MKLLILLLLGGCYFPTTDQIEAIEPLLDATAPLTGGFPVVKYILLGIAGLVAMKRSKT